jgi:hypothetical protein
MTTAPALASPAASTLHKCPIKGCRTMIGEAVHMCYPHWRMVPPDIRPELASLLDNAPDSPEARLAFSLAISAVEDLTGHAPL